MDIEIKILFPTVFLVLLLGLGCKKQQNECPKMGIEYKYSKPAISFYPGSDSLPLGSTIMIEAAVPKSFFDEDRGYNVLLTEPYILGPLGIQKLTNDPILPQVGAMEDIEFSNQFGRLVKDTVRFTPGQNKISWTAYMENDADSFRIKVNCKPKIKGVFTVAFTQAGNRDNECALFKYFLSVKNTDQHLYFLAPLYGYTPIDNRIYSFKIY